MKPFKVVCIDDSKQDDGAKCILGEIYTVIGIYSGEFKQWIGAYFLQEMPKHMIYKAKMFRPVDDTFGPAVCEQIEQIIELEETIEI